MNPDANIIDITASDETPRGAARIANVVSRTFLAERARLDRQQTQRARQRLQTEADRLSAPRTARPPHNWPRCASASASSA